MEEIRKLQKEEQFTHIIFMDDDVEFQIESFYRLFAFLSYIKKEKQNLAVAGRMFRQDKKYIQYTAGKIWNRGKSAACKRKQGYAEQRSSDRTVSGKRRIRRLVVLYISGKLCVKERSVPILYSL